jgi:hypothetical protein
MPYFAPLASLYVSGAPAAPRSNRSVEPDGAFYVFKASFDKAMEHAEVSYGNNFGAQPS